MTTDIPKRAKPQFVDKAELRRLADATNKLMDFRPVEYATGEMAQQLLLECGIRPDDNFLSSELIRLRYEGE